MALLTHNPVYKWMYEDCAYSEFVRDKRLMKLNIDLSTLYLATNYTLLSEEFCHCTYCV